MIILAVRQIVLFPGMVLPIGVGRQRSSEALKAALKAQSPIGILLQKDAENDDPAPADLYRVGTLAEIVRYISAQDGTHHIIVQGQQRFRVREFVEGLPYIAARIEPIEETSEVEARSTGVEARFLNLKQLALDAIELLPERAEGLDAAVKAATSPSMLTDMTATFMDLRQEEKQEILETVDLVERMDKVTEKLRRLTEVLKLSRDIRQSTKGTMDKAQREYYLREQLKTIQKELGEDRPSEMQDLTRAVGEAGMPPEVEKEARKELARLERMSDASAEYSVTRTYIDWLIELPWNRLTPDSLDIVAARKILDEDHWGLEKVKKRIVEFLAVRKLNPEGKSPILCLTGPPGVGKTSLGLSIARAMGRKFVRVSLGGVHDEAEIRGHRRTYVGALPGNIIQGIRKAGTRNPVFMLDEMDKLSASFQGDPSSALLEVLDPEQNATFRDNYLGVPFDLSRVMFIGTANVIDNVPGALRDRCEIIELSGYTEEEKIEIARRYLTARQLAANGLSPEAITLADGALLEVIRHYTREAGCRSLEREIGAILRRVATHVATGELKTARIDAGDVGAILGPRKFESELAQRTSVPGVATGLAWTPVGGEILFVESTRMPGKGDLILTGQLGDVMKESARASLSLLKSRSAELGVPGESLERTDIHIHVPSGAIPKDGPSAGVTMFVSLVSLFVRRTVRSDIAMTGEVSLRGLVLQVGGIKEKVLAAYRAGIRTLLLPARNRKDLEDIPPHVREAVKFVWLETVDDALRVVFDPVTAEAGAGG